MVDNVIETLDKAVKSWDREVLVVFSDVSLETISELRSPGFRRIEERPFQSQPIGKGKF